MCDSQPNKQQKKVEYKRRDKEIKLWKSNHQHHVHFKKSRVIISFCFIFLFLTLGFGHGINLSTVVLNFSALLAVAAFCRLEVG